MIFPEIHLFTLAFQTAYGHTLGQISLDTDVEDQNRQHDQHKPCIHRAVFCGRLLCLHQVQEACGQSPLIRSVTRVLMIMYSFQKDRKLNRMTVMMEGLARGKMIWIIVLP